jgi:hypothetical protein
MVTAQLPPTVERAETSESNVGRFMTAARLSISVEEDPLSHGMSAPSNEPLLTKTPWRILEEEGASRFTAWAGAATPRLLTAVDVEWIPTGARPALRTAGRRSRLLPAPRLVIERQAKALLTSRVRELIQPLAAIAQTQAFRSHVYLRSIVVRPFVDPDDDSRELVLEIHVSALPSQGLAYWDGLGAALNSFRDTLPASVAAILGERLSVHVVWPSADGNGV